MEAAEEATIEEDNVDIVLPQAEALKMMLDGGVVDLLGATPPHWPKLAAQKRRKPNPRLLGIVSQEGGQWANAMVCCCGCQQMPL